MCAHADNKRLRAALLGAVLAGAASLAQAQALNCRWNTVDDGGGLLAGGEYTVNGTVGQPDAARATGGVYGLTGGFWRGARAIFSRLIFADGFATADTTAWSLVAPVAEGEVTSHSEAAASSDDGEAVEAEATVAVEPPARGLAVSGDSEASARIESASRTGP